MGTQHFILGKSVLGARKIPDLRVIPGLEVRFHHSYCFFCIRCGEIWGRLLHDRAEYTQCVCRPCLAHGDGRFSHASFFPGEPDNFERNWPVAAMRHELLAEISFTERLYKL